MSTGSVAERSSDVAAPALRLHGRTNATLDEIEALLLARAGEPALKIERGAADDGAPALFVTAHPSAPPIEIARRTELELAAEPATAGAGLHTFAVELARSLPVDWAPDGDTTGFFRSGDEAALVRHFARWLSGVARDALEMVDGGLRGIALLLPADVSFEDDSAVLTPLGPRDRTWLAAVAADGNAGADALPWWAPGVGATYHRDLALHLMWTELRPRRPIDDEERAVSDRVLALLEIAHTLDPALPLPWRAWSELFEQRGEESLRATRAHLKAETAPRLPPIGYRSRPVRYELPAGWSIRTPGDLRTRFAEHGTFVAWDAKHTYWVTTITAQAPRTTEETLDDLKEPDGDGELYALEKGAMRGRGRFGTSDDGWNVLRAQAVVGGHAALGTLLYKEEADRENVLEAWGSIDHPDASAS